MRAAPRLSEIQRYPIVGGIALLSIGVTLLSWTKTDISPLYADAMVRHGQLWRLLTSVLPHGGFLHLFFNLYWLWAFGSIVEETYGHARTAALMLLLAFVPSAFEYALLDGGIGLSGIGYGLFGMLWILSKRDERFADAIDDRTIQLFVVWFFICIVTTVTKIMPIANIAHGTGALVGILVGFAIAVPKRRALAAIAIVLLSGLSVWGATQGRPKVNLAKDRGYDEAHYGYEALMAKQNEQAVRWLRDAVAYRPKEASFWYNLGIAYARVGNKAGYVTAMKNAAEYGQAPAQYFIGTLYAHGAEGFPKDDHQAMEWFEKAAGQDDPDVLNDIAWEYATTSDPGLRNPKAALEYARRMAALEKEHPDAAHLDTLAEALYANGNHSEAVTVEQQAIALTTENNKAEFAERLKKYQSAADESQRANVVSSSRTKPKSKSGA